MRKSLLFTLIFFYAHFIFAQRAEDPDAINIEFDSISSNFGSVIQGEIVSHSFHFKNNGKIPFRFTEGHTSTSAAVVEYPREMIVPGASGIIRYQFLTSGKLGNQDKTVTLTLSCGVRDTFIVLRIRGIVTAKPKVPASLVKFDTLAFDCGFVASGTKASHDFYFTNTSYNAVTLNTTGDGRCYGDVTKELIMPGKSASIHVWCVTNGTSKHERMVTVSVNSADAFETIILHLNYVNVVPDSATEMSFVTDTILTGRLDKRHEKAVVFRFTNTGLKPLIISGVQQGGEWIRGYPKDPIAPGGSGTIILTFTVPEQKGPFQERATVISNNRNGDIQLVVIGDVK